MVYRKVPKGFNRKTFLSKGVLKRETANIFVSRLLELSLQKTRCKSLCTELFNFGSAVLFLPDLRDHAEKRCFSGLTAPFGSREVFS